MTATQDDTIAELRRSVAELRRERDAALSEKAALVEELAARDSEFGERIEQQSATIDVLKVMSASPGDPQPVFDLITTGHANCAGPSRRCCLIMMVSCCICERGVGMTRLRPKAI